MTTRAVPYRYVALFAIPPGVGVAGFVASVTGEAVSALAVGAGLLTTVLIAGLLVLALRSGGGTDRRPE